MTVQSSNNNLNYWIDPTFTKVNTLLVLTFERNAEGDWRDSFSHFYVPKVQVKDLNVLIDGKSLFDLPVKREEEPYEKNIEMSWNNDYTSGNLLDFAYFKENYRLISIDLSKQTKLKDPQKLILLINLKTKLIEQQCFSLLKNWKKLLLNFYKNNFFSVNIL